MIIKIKRDIFLANSTLGLLYFGDVFFCNTLEKKTLTTTIDGLTDIPFGTYEVIINYSTRFKRPMPLLLSVPFFTGIRIHPGNTYLDTHGCILVGKKTAENILTESRIVFLAFFQKLYSVMQLEKVYVKITNETVENAR
jgi:hypothetical protein